MNLPETHHADEPVAGQASGRRLFSPASEAERRTTGRRLLWAVPVALLVLVAIIYFGPSAEEVDRKFTPYGDDGPLRLMPEISVDDGQDVRHQQARRDVSPPPPAPDYEVEPRQVSEQAPEVFPESSEREAPVVDDGTSQEAPVDAVASDQSVGDAAVDMRLPSQQVDSEFIIRRMMRPIYPLDATAADRAQPVITVTAAWFVQQTGDVSAIMIQGNTGSGAFAVAARQAMEQWLFEPRPRPDGLLPAARWLVVEWNFRSPFSGQAR